MAEGEPAAKRRRADLPVRFGGLTEQTAEQLRQLNCALLPVQYNEKFYKDVLTCPSHQTTAAFLQDVLIGAICSRMENRVEGGVKLYIMTLGVLSPYRRSGIASQLLQKTLDWCAQQDFINEVSLNVQISNDTALEFYKKFGFEVVDRIDNYYKRIEPPHCFVLRKLLRATATTTTTTNANPNTITLDSTTGITSPLPASTEKV
eukprot:gnl/Hemi2/4599_TR1589_c0_g1_i1.p1 gnl/Hemi2/4599_TR1589_c0_g1~~gnl/Hemi2/4599_TR1589_c0_g1_i1.p1  ORF type:complete len:204 (-),score=50.15 gnl/Hemi2/4599_TR1589_c0_g1_i1:78-689(-)